MKVLLFLVIEHFGTLRHNLLKIYECGNGLRKSIAIYNPTIDLRNKGTGMKVIQSLGTHYYGKLSGQSGVREDGKNVGQS